MTDDVVAELDRQLLHWHEPLLQRARDEIVALRASLERHDRLVINAVVVATPAIRADALEEAARVCDERGATTGPQDAYAVLDVESYKSACGGCAFDIRALKDKSDG